ncbi:MAG: glycogen synthase GlgA [Oscillospiraceae bacterium]|nr:glycogen synthase GlgA [Oscillospiraceae bacterium]MBR7084110.1 glycogen synthase GlgA [Oscillospiraceae bacterium]
MTNILFAASECVPFVKTGGLADVVGALPKNLNKERFDVRVIIPYYTCIPGRYRNFFHYRHHFFMDYAGRQEHVGIMEYEYHGIKYYYVDNEYYFNGETPYSSDLRWDIERFTFFCKAVLAMMPVIGFHPDIIHCHDWQTGLIPVLLHSTFATHPFYQGVKSIMTIHNLKFQGVWDIDAFQHNTQLPDYMFTPDKLEFHKDANMLKGGLVYADYITTVSETYAEEIKTPEYGEQLDGLLSSRQMSLRGIVNGIDYSIFDPKNDKKIFYNYDVNDVITGKAENKRKLQEELGLEQDGRKMLIGLISRLTDQKGLNLLSDVFEGRFLDDNTQFVLIGTGEPAYENAFRYFAGRYPGNVSANICYNDELAHKLYAAADMMLVPSRFEPCGLTQLIALRYGSIPLVRETGGLKDTVQPYNEFELTGTGFTFKEFWSEAFLGSVNYAKSVFFNYRNNWDDMIRRGMQQDWSWNTSARQYEGMYEWLLGKN